MGGRDEEMFVPGANVAQAGPRRGGIATSLSRLSVSTVLEAVPLRSPGGIEYAARRPVHLTSKTWSSRLGLLVTVLVLGRAATGVAAPCDQSNLLAGRSPASAEGLRHDLSRLTDGVVGEPGAQWNAPVVVELSQAGAFVTYDLGEPREISAAYLQGDANDTYQLSGSLDGAPGTYIPLATFPNVAAAGHGLRDRAIQVAPRTVRFVRLDQPAGDSYYSVAELAVYCKQPEPFPPHLTIDLKAPGDEAAAAAKRRRESFRALYGVALVALVWFGYLAFRSSGRSGASAG